VKNFKKSGGFAKKSFGPKKRFAPGEPTERFQATCASCHTACEVPFKPNGKKPVYCRDCFKGKEDAPATGRAHASSPSDMTRQFDMLNFKLDRLIKAVEGRSRA
jgi:CxxC-x17-CxxC domain-containing protein